MQFAARAFTIAKDPEHPDENQDAWAVDPERGIAVVADGVTSAIFSGRWAALLTEAVVAELPDPDDAAAFAEWLRQRRAAWAEQIDTGGLAWFQKAKLPLGAFSTLLWVRLLPAEEEEPGRFGARRLVGRAVGDSCLFHARHGETLRTFPIERSEQFEADPIVLGSVDLKRDQLVEFLHLEATCYDDDLLVLCTDAAAEWALREAEAGSPPDWRRYWKMSEAAWRDEVAGLREQGRMRYDDATLVMLCVGAQPAELAGPEEAAAPVAGPRPKPAPEDKPGEGDPATRRRPLSEQPSGPLGQVSHGMWRGLQALRARAERKFRERFRRGPDERP